jgi:diguanylate cyclase (GGDEF)-like protein/PAS domain S-box-containing protein
MPAYALIAEPDPAQAAVYSHLVSVEGLEFELVRDGEAARTTVSVRGSPALIITELSLPRSDGFALLTHLRAIATLQQSPAVVVSAFRELLEAAGRMKNELGISAIIDKPAPIEALRRAVKQALLSSSATPGAGTTPQRHHPPAPPLVPPAVAHGGRDLAHDAREACRRRLSRLRAMGLAEDTGIDPALQALLDEARTQFGVAAAFVTLALEDRHLVKGHSGLDGPFAQSRSLPLNWTFLRQVLESDHVLVVPDAVSHPLFATEALVRDGTLRGFAGAPLAGPGGEVIGTLCLIEKEPLRLGSAEVDALVQLARRVTGELELRGVRARAGGKQRGGEALRALEGAVASSAPTLAHLTAALDNIDSGLVLVDGSRRVVFANEVFAELLGKTPDELRGLQRDELLQLFSGLFDDPAGFLRQMQVPKVGPYAFRAQFELQRPKRMVVRWVGKPVQLGSDGELGHLGIITDITAEADLALEREALARTDALTGLANRRGGEEALQREVARVRRGKSRLSLALFDLDDFKRVNDEYGHAGGDDALRAIARILLAAVRGADLVVRWGGDELLAILPSTGLEGARKLAERVRTKTAALSEPEFGRVTVSAGVTELAAGEDASQALARADARLYEAKAAGRNCVR